ncbi:hypothetical protein [Streptomyces sp. NPDC059489]
MLEQVATHFGVHVMPRSVTDDDRIDIKSRNMIFDSAVGAARLTRPLA